MINNSMVNNAIINYFRLKDLLNILDARARVSIFTGIGELPIKEAVNVYELLADKEFINSYGKYDVTGLVSVINRTNILITQDK